MSNFETRAHIGADRKLELTLPAHLAGTNVKITVTKENGLPQPLVSREERNRVLEELARNGVDDPSFKRWPEGDFEVREPFD